MNRSVELSRRTWNAAVKLAVVISMVGAVVAAAVSTAGDVPQAAIVLPVIIVAFTASWIRTARMASDPAPVRAHATHGFRAHATHG